MGSTLTWFLFGGSKLTVFLVWVSKLTFFVRGVEIDFVVFGSISAWYSCMDRNWLSFSAGIAIDLFFCTGRKLLVFNVEMDWLDFFVGGRNWLCFCMRTENHLVLVSTELDFVFVGGIEFDFVLVLGSSLTCFLCGGSKLTVRAEIDLFVAWWSINLVFVWVAEIDLVFGCRPRIAWF